VLMDQTAKTHNCNVNAQMRLNDRIKNKRIKNVLDPKGILAPGKNGIWPRLYDRELEA
jgi:hypothetical protein